MHCKSLALSLSLCFNTFLVQFCFSIIPSLSLLSSHLFLFYSLMQPSRRKTPLFSGESFSMKHRKNNNLSIFVVVFSIFLFGVFMYNEDVKSIAEFPFSSTTPSQAQEEQNESTTKQQTSTNPVQETIKTVKETTVLMSSRTSLEQPQDEHGQDDDISQNSTDKKGEKEKIELTQVVIEEEEEEEEVELPPEECDLFTGEWVYDNETHPLYKEDECEFLTAQVTCMRNGRQDSMYQNWRWQPRDCSLPK